MTSLAALFTSHFVTPLMLGLLGLLPLIIILYLLKLRRTAIVIPSTQLWTRSLQDVTANAPFQRLIVNLLLILQLLIVLFIVLALARPYLLAEGARGDNLCLLLDHSASMNVNEGGATRLAMAQAAATKLVDQMKRGDKIMVIAFAEKADVLCELTDDRALLRRVINGVQPTDTRSYLHDALLVARSLAPDNREKRPAVAANLQLIIVSDGRFTDPDELGAVALRTDYLKIGASSHNAGITAFTVRAAEGKDAREAFVMVHNEDEAALTTTLSLYLDDELLAVEEITLEPAADREVVFALTNLEAGMLRAQLDAADDLPADNVAWAALKPRATVKVLLAAPAGSTGAYFLAHALSLDPRVELATTAPAEYADPGENDLVIFDGFAPPTLPPAASVFINALPPMDGVTVLGLAEAPPVLAKDADHPLMRYLNLSNVRINRALKLGLPPGARTLLSTKGGALIADVSRGGRQVLIIGFDLAQSNWPLNLSFPLFVQNLVSWPPKAALGGEGSVNTGRPLAILPAPGVETAAVTSPDGRRHTVALDPLRPVFFAATEQAGVYTIQRGEEKDAVAVNLLDRNESAVRPAAELKVGRGEVEGQTGGLKRTRELWRWGLLLAIGLLGAEWWVYSRRAWM
jgi:Ca-activated chloride channel homolog